MFQAFEKAWEVACESLGAVVLVVPENNYLLKPITFSGPCKSLLLAVQVYKCFKNCKPIYIYTQP